MKIQSEFVPVGTIVAYGGEVKDRYIELENAGWLVCDGRELERGHYSELYESIQSAFGSANEALFNLPDLRGLFFRVVSGNSNLDPKPLGAYNWPPAAILATRWARIKSTPPEYRSYLFGRGFPTMSLRTAA